MRTRARVCVGAWVRVSVCACVRACGCVLSASAVRLRALRTEAMARGLAVTQVWGAIQRTNAAGQGR